MNMFKTAASQSGATREHILQTALRLFREQGFEAATMRDIAREAGLSLGAAYYYFETKEAIVAAYYDYVQAEHLRRARAQFASARGLRERLTAAIHTKLDLLQTDRVLLTALFRYGGDPQHPLSWFGPQTRRQRELSMLVFQHAIEGEKLPRDVSEVAPALLWTMHMGILLYFLYDNSPSQHRTRRLTEGAIELVIQAKRLVVLPLLRPMRRKITELLKQADLLPAASASSIETDAQMTKAL
jgi:AcrR family transcriptional regulator